ncbi:MAG: transcriptional regulator, partial [Gammaproteobacteria bacterium RIFCSPHIGHO2_12_FULL_41_15]
YSEHKATFNIEKLELMEGFLPRRATELVLDWAELHQTELMNDWNLCQSHEQPHKIEPLK